MSADAGASRAFVDTNVVVYAYDTSAGRKHALAGALLRELWESRTGCLSVQVLQELFVTLTRKVPLPLDPETASSVVGDLTHWTTHTPDGADVLAAIGIHRRARVSFWDAMILRSASRLACDVLYTEDLSPGRSYEGVRVENPFKAR